MDELVLEASAPGDRLHRFMFEHLAVRGELVRLDASLRSVLQHDEYPDAVAGQLGQSLAAAVLMSATIKFEGSVTVQLQSDGPVQGIVAQATHQRTVRGLARWDQAALGDLRASARTPAETLLADGRLAITIQRNGQTPYQAIVPLEVGDLANALEDYFNRSEQLPTFFVLAGDSQMAAGLMLQQLPAVATGEDDWERLKLMAATLSADELKSLAAPTLLHRVFSEDDLRLFEDEPVAFRCGCSRSRVDEMLLALGSGELQQALDEDGGLEVRCEFCNRRHVYDRIDVEGLLHAREPVSGPPTLQ